MKVFITSLIIFIILIIVLVINCIYICNFSNEFDSLVEEFKEANMNGAEDTFERLSTLWDDNKFLITLTNDHNKIEDIEQSLLKMKTAIISKHFPLYTEARLALSQVSKMLKEYDTFSWEGLM